jgi:DNA-binding transcriptional regulator YhcF (GntR family)
MTLNIRAVVTLEILQAHFANHGVIPAQHKVALRLGLSPSSTDIVRAAYSALESAGFIRRLSKDWSRIKMIQAEDKDAADFARRANSEARYTQHRQIVEGLQGTPPLSLLPKLRGLQPLSRRKKVYWLDGFPQAPTGSAA